MTDNDVHDLYDDAPRYLAEALKTVAPDWVSMADLVENYDPPKPNNMADIQSDTKRAEGKRLTVPKMKERLLTDAIDDINIADEPMILHDEDMDAYRFADGVDPYTLTDAVGKPLIDKPVFGDPFNPDTGIFGHNIRTPKPDGYHELRESMCEFGYLPGHPIIKDENGVIIAGHRRATVADELEITPEVLELSFGSGDAADAERLKLALGSNVGFEPVSSADRQKIALHLYEGKNWSMAKIAAALNVSTMRVSRDLRGLTTVKPERGGRGHKQPAPEPAPEPIDADVIETQDPRPAAEVEPEPAEPVDLDAAREERHTKPTVDLEQLVLFDTEDQSLSEYDFNWPSEDLLSRRIYVDEKKQKKIGDCSAVEISYLAENLRQLAYQVTLRAEFYEDLAARMVREAAATAGQLNWPEDEEGEP